MLLAYQTGGKTSTATLPEGPRQGWRNLFVDDIGNAVLADPTGPWETADNYNPAHPFNSIDQLSIAIGRRPPPG